MGDDHGGAIRVLHVDDEPDLAELVATFLERTDDRLVVETEANVEDGLDRLLDPDDRFDCVVSDYEMPGMNGQAFLDRVVRKSLQDRPEDGFGRPGKRLRTTL